MSGNRKRKLRFAAATPARGAASVFDVAASRAASGPATVSRGDPSSPPPPSTSRPRRAPLARATFLHDIELSELERHVHEHVFQTINFGALGGIEEQLFSLLTERDIPDQVALDLSKLMVTRAIERTCDDAGRYMTSVPYGITEAERKAVEFDDDCPFCEAEAHTAAYVKAHAGEQRVEEPCGCCDDVADSWRAKHAETLRKHGLGPPETAGD